ncbi:MAG: NAD(P)/FAD-dependent oxidoreductase [Clostridiales bacterium]|nr:NAD(P)/FAD-dependent oxidoreductase [Clostridiales bacterium]
MKKIIVAGAGHGGIAAAYNLAKKGYDVTVYDRVQKEEDLGHEWQDFFHKDALTDSGFPACEVGMVHRVPISFYGPDKDVPPIGQTVKDDEFEMHMYRKDLYAHILKYSKEAGVKFVFGCSIKKPLMLGNRVVGFETSDGEKVIGDLVIDACGINSPLRTQLPSYLGVQNKFLRGETIFVYRAYYNRLKKFPEIPNDYHVYFLNDGKDGMGWIVTNEDSVDVLIGKPSPFTKEEALSELERYDEFAPHRGKKVLLGGGIYEIPVRQPLAIMVADGYAAVGDSAAMTVPIVGSGIANTLKAGKMLADAVLADKNGEYSASTLYNYEAAYYKQLGSSLAMVDLIKILLQNLTLEDLRLFFASGVVTSEDLSFNSNEASLSTIFANIKPSDVVDRFKKVGKNKALFKKVLTLIKNIAILRRIMLTMPKKYNEKSLAAFADRYNKFFASLVK